MGTKTVRVQWDRIYWRSGDVWNNDIIPQLQTLKAQDLATCVYVISVAGVFAIRYPNAISPTLYIGQGNLHSRIKQHCKWMDKLNNLVTDYSFRIDVCRPQTYNNSPAHIDLEATLIHQFIHMYGCIPIHNKRKEYPCGKFRYNLTELKRPLMIGRGFRYQWAIEPLPSNTYHKKFTASYEECIQQ